MIKIYGAASDLGVALFDPDTNKYLYGELCTAQRVKEIVINFPQHDIELWCEREWRDDLQELLFLLPHLEGTADINVKSKINVQKSLIDAAKVKQKRNFILIYISIGIMLGSLIMVPTAMEYRNSVLSQAQSMQSFTAEFAQNKPDEQKVQELYVSLDKLYSRVRIESVSYSMGKFTVIFSSANDDVRLEDLEGFEGATLEKLSVLENKKGSSVTLYELEGNL